MTMISTTTRYPALPLPAPRTQIHVRPGTVQDIPFIDSLQRVHSRQLGWMPKAQLEGKVMLGHVLVAEGDADAKPVGYVIGNDQYFKRDDVGIIYQLAVVPGARRGLIGAALVRAMFDRAAYGCRLFCCWCAQDIEANHFWESLGFVPLAFRAGSRGKKRIHIFWQKRIRPGDDATPYWFPAQTGGGLIREDRLVLPIPPGTHWSDAKPLVLPGMQAFQDQEMPALPAPARAKPKARKAKPAQVRQLPPESARGTLWFAPPQAAPEQTAPAEKPARREKASSKNDPRLVAAARELRDLWLEKVVREPSLLLPQGRYDVVRLEGRDDSSASPDLLVEIIEPATPRAKEIKLLPAA